MNTDFLAVFRHRLNCRLLRETASGFMRQELPRQRPGESLIDYLVRHGLARSPQIAAEMLIIGAGLAALRDEILADQAIFNELVSKWDTVRRSPLRSGSKLRTNHRS